MITSKYKKIFISCSMAFAGLSIFLYANNNVVKANDLAGKANQSLATKMQSAGSKSTFGSTKIGYQELDTRVDDDSQIKKILYKLKMNRLLSRLANGVLTVLNGVMILQITH